MNALVVYDTQYGNTEKVAHAIAEALNEYGQAQALKVDRADSRKLEGVDIVVLGSPTHAWKPTMGMRTFLAHVSREDLAAASVATFDTRYHLPWFLTGSAARGIAKQVKQMGGTLLVPPESFFIKGREGPLENHELERAKTWARAVHGRFAAKLALA